MKPTKREYPTQDPSLFAETAEKHRSADTKTAGIGRELLYRGRRIRWTEDLEELAPPPAPAGPPSDKPHAPTCLGQPATAGLYAAPEAASEDNRPQPLTGPLGAREHNANMVAELRAHIRRKRTNEKVEKVKGEKST